MKISYLDLIHSFSSNFINVDFLAIAISPWHALGIDAELIRDEYQERKGIVLIAPHPKDGYIITASDFKIDINNNIQIFYLSEFREGYKFILRMKSICIALLKINKNKKILSLICPYEPYTPFLSLFLDKKIHQKRYPCFVLIDEGIGTYSSNSAWETVAEIDYPQRNMPLFRKYFSNFINKILYFRIPIKNKFLFKNENGSLVLNEEIAKNYVRRLGSVQNVTSDSKIAIVVTQPFSENNSVTLENEMIAINLIIDLIYSYKIFIKPHPRENIKKYLSLSKKNIVLLENSKPIEEIIIKMSPNIIVGYTSTSLMVANALYNVKSYSAVEMLLPFINNDKIKKILLEQYILMKNHVLNIKDIKN